MNYQNTNENGHKVNVKSTLKKNRNKKQKQNKWRNTKPEKKPEIYKFFIYKF